MHFTEQQEKLFQNYVSEALTHLNAASIADTNYKEVVDVASESLGLSKGEFSGFVKAKFQDKLVDIYEKSEKFSYLDDLLNT